MPAVAPPARERTGVLVVRAWIEPAHENGLRARIVQTLDVTRRQNVVSAAATPDEVYAAVRSWLEAFLADGEED